MKNHPIADVWPMMNEAKLAELADDIRKNGQLVPVWVYEGKILDGRNRWEACKIAGVEPKTQEYTGDEPTAFAVSLNDRRRHMNKGSLAAVAAELEPHFAADAKRRQIRKPKAVSVVEKIPQLRPRPRLRHPLRCGYGKNARTDRHQAAGKVVRRRTTSRGRRESVVAILPEQIRHQAAGRTRPFGDVRPTRQPIPHCVSLDTVSGDT